MSTAGAAALADQKIHVVQGEYYVTDDQSVVLTTILGSCVTACIRDPVAKVGGMNHFLLPDGGGGSGASGGLQYGVHAMELLVNGVLKRGGRRERLEAKLFGGARLAMNLPDIGRRNAEFANEFLRREGIGYTGGSLGGTAARRIQYWPCSGRARQATLAGAMPTVDAAPKRVQPPADTGAVELF